MCGIAGTVAMSLTGRQRDLVSRIVRYQIRRGPDDQSVEVASRQSPAVILGHDRLSILDLSRAANQPFWSANRRYCLTFNGEIYNYREIRDELRQHGKIFQTQSDTE